MLLFLCVRVCGGVSVCVCGSFALGFGSVGLAAPALYFLWVFLVGCACFDSGKDQSAKKQKKQKASAHLRSAVTAH